MTISRLLSVFDPVRRKLQGKNPMIIVGAGVGLIALIGIILASYFTSIYVPDSEYTKVSATVQTMSEHAAVMAAFDREFADKRTSVSMDDERVAATKTAADNYVNLLLQLQDSPVIKKDKVVKDAYDRNKRPIDEYGASSVSLLGTLAIYSAVTKQCGELSKRIDEPQTVAQFDALAAGCKEHVTKHKSVPINTFNKEVYVKYRKATLDFITAARKYYVASNSKSGSRSSVQRAMTNMDKAQLAMQKVGAGSDQYLKSSPNSSDQLGMLHEVIEERKESWPR